MKASIDRRRSGARKSTPFIPDIEEYKPNRFRVRKAEAVKEQKRLTKQEASEASDRYDSKTEADYARHLGVLQYAGQIKKWWHHPFTGIRLPGERNTYRPDFLVQHLDGSMEFRETKGWHQNIRASITKLKTAAGIQDWAKWTLVKKIDGQWVEREVMAR